MKTEEIIDLSAKYLREVVGEDLLKYFKPTENISYYKLPANRFGFENTKKLKKNRRIRKNWTKIWVFWNFNYPKVNGVRSGLWVKLNKQLELNEPIELDYIPKFVWEKRASDFISINKVKLIGDKNLTKTEFGRENPKLKFDDKKSEYIYEIWNKKTEEIDLDGKKHGVLEIIKISALTGKVIEITNGYYGKIIIR
ncbi:hypothetical protein [Formosa algae]|uniref:hypothetical protein n=1 Tax=Formosa algae TaxID=225843 RepID=UPI0011AF8241|nr:hypothetical protein [Formosa algae]